MDLSPKRLSRPIQFSPLSFSPTSSSQPRKRPPSATRAGAICSTNIMQQSAASLARSRGGDGFLAIFDGPARGVRCACAIADEVKSLGIDLRAELHTGECEVTDSGDIGPRSPYWGRRGGHGGGAGVKHLKELVAGFLTALRRSRKAARSRVCPASGAPLPLFIEARKRAQSSLGITCGQL
jgi:hypothetical protein